MGFNNAQQCAIQHNKGPAMVLAGPGSGKTTVITHRIQYLIEHYHVLPQQILVITFTKMAAKEMQERFLKLTNNKYTSVSFGTFHAIYFTILKHTYQFQADSIITQAQQMEFLYSILDSYELDIDNQADFVRKILGEISHVKSEGIQIQTYESINCPPKVFQNIYAKYQAMLQRKRKLDFDDMMTYCYALFQKRPEVLKAWQEKYKYILIDEFQDISTLQYAVIKQLADKHENLFIVGDDDQSIYGFRGAKPEIMLGFTRDYPAAKRIDMNLNYRSTAHIVQAAKSVIDTNKNRFYKDIQTVNESGEKVAVWQFADTDMQNHMVADEIECFVKRGIVYENQAILTRTNTGMGQILQVLARKNIPFATKEKIINVYEHWIAQDIFAYMRIAQGSRTRVDFLKIINKPLRYLSRNAFSTPMVDMQQLLMFYQEKPWMKQRICDMWEDIRFLKQQSPFAAINYIRKGIGYDEYLKQYAKEHATPYEELEQVLQDLMQSAKEAVNFEMWQEQIANYTQMLEKAQTQKQSNKEAVQVCTMHSSKGLEYEVVYVLDVNEGMIPYKQAVLESEIEEERRMFYVAMTRAKKRLYLCTTQERFNKHTKESRFLEELDPNYIDVKIFTK